MSKPTYEEARDAYESVLGTGNFDINYIVQVLAGERECDEECFRNLALSLDIMSIEAGDKPTIYKRFQRTNSGKYIAEGASGVIFKGASGIIYKKIAIDIFEKGDDGKYTKTRRAGELIEDEVKEAFLEAWFQTVLSLDKKYGRNIGKIMQFRRDPTIKKEASGDKWWETDMNSAVFYITMELIPNKLGGLLEKITPKRGKTTIAAIKPMFSKLAEVLMYFNAKYGFRHRDLHEGNVMFTDEPYEIKIIDFGRCCMNFEWGGGTALFTMDKWGADSVPAQVLKGLPAKCFSLDLFIYLISILQDKDYENKMSASLYEMLNDMVTSSPATGSQNLFEYLKSKADAKAKATKAKYSPFWDSYPWSFALWDASQIKALADTPSVYLAGFKAFVDASADGGYSDKGVRKHKTRKGGFKQRRRTYRM